MKGTYCSCRIEPSQWIKLWQWQRSKETPSGRKQRKRKSFYFLFYFYSLCTDMRCSLCKTGCVNDYWCVHICSRWIDGVVRERVILWHVYYVLKKDSPFRKERWRDKKEIGVRFLFTEFATPPWEPRTNLWCFFTPICSNSLSNFQMWRTGGGDGSQPEKQCWKCVFLVKVFKNMKD